MEDLEPLLDVDSDKGFLDINRKIDDVVFEDLFDTQAPMFDFDYDEAVPDTKFALFDAQSARATASSPQNETGRVNRMNGPTSGKIVTSTLRRRRQPVSKAALPQESVDVLKGWMMSPEHIHYPYPTDVEKGELMAKTGFNLKQLNNWFTNNRKRFWKPRVEALNAETKRLSREYEDEPTSSRSDRGKCPGTPVDSTPLSLDRSDFGSASSSASPSLSAYNQDSSHQEEAERIMAEARARAQHLLVEARRASDAVLQNMFGGGAGGPVVNDHNPQGDDTPRSDDEYLSSLMASGNLDSESGSGLARSSGSDSGGGGGDCSRPPMFMTREVEQPSSEDRAAMVQRILVLLRQRRPDSAPHLVSRLPSLASRLETGLREGARDRDDYLEEGTLEKRIARLQTGLRSDALITEQLGLEAEVKVERGPLERNQTDPGIPFKSSPRGGEDEDGTVDVGGGVQLNLPPKSKPQHPHITRSRSRSSPISPPSPNSASSSRSKRSRTSSVSSSPSPPIHPPALFISIPTPGLGPAPVPITPTPVPPKLAPVASTFSPDFQPQDRSVYSIRVVSYEESGEGYTMYNVQVSCGGRAHLVAHRFREFHQLGKNLLSKGYQTNKKELPPKTWCRTHAGSFLERRKDLLQVFLTELLSAPGIGSEMELRTFLGLVHFDAFPAEYEKCMAVVQGVGTMYAAGRLSEVETVKIKNMVLSGDVLQVACVEQTLHLLRQETLFYSGRTQ